MSKIIEKGQVPFILAIDEGDIYPNVVLVAAESRIPYVAISHVWSDGLGNMHQSSVPRWQLLRISKIVRNFQQGGSTIRHFWLDTLCIPPDSAGVNEVQNSAIRPMRSVYWGASAVLVLDSWLYNCSLKDMSDVEITVRIFLLCLEYSALDISGRCASQVTLLSVR